MAQHKHEGDKVGNVDWMNYADGVFFLYFDYSTVNI